MADLHILPHGMRIASLQRGQRLRRKSEARRTGLAFAFAMALSVVTALRNIQNQAMSSGMKLPPGENTTMKSPICDMLGIEFPLLAFSHCRDVVAAVSRAGGFGVLGATAHSPETIEQELKWIDDHADGKPYGRRRADPGKHFDRGRKGRHLEKPGGADFAGASRLHPQPPEEIRHRADDDQRRRQPAAAVRRAARAGGARRLRSAIRSG